jgi:hypothetical protein
MILGYDEAFEQSDGSEESERLDYDLREDYWS